MEHLENMENVFVLNHPLIQHKISRLRDVNTGTNEFRKLIEEIAMLMGYEALRDLPLEDVEVKTPIESCMTPMIAGKKMAIVPILRAGLGMVGMIHMNLICFPPCCLMKSTASEPDPPVASMGSRTTMVR